MPLGLSFQNGVIQCGWDYFANSSSVIQGLMINNSGSVQSANARFGDGLCYNPSGASGNGFSLGSNLARFQQGIYVFPASLPGSGLADVLYWSDSGSIQLRLRVNSMGAIQFYLANGTTAVGAISVNGVLQANRGAYIQTDITINSSTGAVICYVDTSGASAVINSSGVNSQSTANAWVNQTFFPQPLGAWLFDDWWGLDTTGSAPFNALLGPLHIHYDPPTSDASPNQFSTQPSQTTGNHYENVNAATTPSGTVYNFDNNPTDEELYGFGTISAVKVYTINELMYLELDAAGARTVQATLKSSSATQNGTAFTPASSFGYASQISTVDPNTSAAWASGTVAAAQAADLGIIVVT